MGLKGTLRRGWALSQIALTIGGAAHAGIADAKPDLVQQYTDYAAKVRLPDTEAKIARELRAATTAKKPSAGIDRATTKRLGRVK